MKVLMANKFFFLKGGCERVFFEERQFLLDQGHEVIDFSMDHPHNLPSPHADHFVPRLDFSQGLRADQARGFKRKLLAAVSFVRNKEAAARLRRLISRERPDIAHLHNIYHQLTPIIIPILNSAGVKTILTLHDYKLVCPSYLMLSRGRICEACQEGAFWRAAAQKCLEGSLSKSLLLTVEAYWHKWARSYEAVDLFLAPSRFMARMVGRRRIDQNKIKVLHNGVDTSVYTLSGTDKGYAVYFGRISREKGVATLVQAFRLMRTQMGSGVEGGLGLKVIGEGPLRQELMTAAPEVDFPGHVSGERLKDLVREASFVVVPSEWYENCSMSLLEAMACAKAVVGSRVGGIPEQVTDGQTGFLFEKGDAQDLARKMSLLAGDEALRGRLGLQARRKVEAEYSLEGHCQRLLKIYQDLLSSPA